MEQNKLLRSLAKLLQGPADSMQGTERLKDLGTWDSLAMIEYIAMADDDYGLELTPAEVRKCVYVQDLVDLILVAEKK